MQRKGTAQAAPVVLRRHRAARAARSCAIPILPEQVDYLIMECTYGDKPHRDPQLAYDELRQVVGAHGRARRQGDHPRLRRRAHPGTGLLPEPA